MLTKKHFEAIADILHNHREVSGRGVNDRMLIDLIACDLGDYFDSENERFDLERFINRTRGVKLPQR